MAIPTTTFQGELRQGHQSVATKSGTLTKDIGEKIAACAGLTGEKLQLALAEIQELQNQRAMMDKLCDIANEVDKDEMDLQ